MAKTVTFEIDTDLCELTVDSGTLFLGEQAPIVFAGYTPASGNTLFLSLFDKDHVTPLADNATSANTLDLRYEAMRDAFGDCKAAHSFYATVIERTSGGSWVGQVLAAGHVRVEWSPVVFDAMSGNPATLKGATGATGAALTWDMLTDAQKASLKGADGANGATGATGPQGPQGPQGIQGVAGPQGAAGTNGTNGSDGADGVSPVVSVTDVIGGHKVTIVDASGTKEFTVLNGSTGAQGPQGVQGVQGLPGIQGEKGDTGDPSHALEGERMRNSPSQRQMILALKKIWTALGGTIVCLMLCLSCFAVNRDTEWQDVPPETRIGTVVDLGRSGGGGGGGGLTPENVTNISSVVVTNHVDSGYLCTLMAAANMMNKISFVQLKGKPTTIEGYGITDAYTKSEAEITFMPLENFISFANATYGRWEADLPSISGLVWDDQPIWYYGRWVWNNNLGYSAIGTNEYEVVSSTFKCRSSITGTIEFSARRTDIVPASSFGQPFVTWDNVPSTNGLVTASVTNGLCTVAAAQAMTNDATIVRGDFDGDAWDIKVSYAKFLTNQIGWSEIDPSTTPTTISGYGITDAYTKSQTETASTNAATSVVSNYLDYALMNLTAATLSLRSGEIGNYETTADFTLALSFADNGRSGDCLLYVANTDAAEDHTIIPEPASIYTFVSADLEKALSLGKATTNLLMFTRVKADTVLISKTEVK